MCFISFPFKYTKYSLTTQLAEQNEGRNAAVSLASPSTHLSRTTAINWIFAQFWMISMNRFPRIKSQILNWCHGHKATCWFHQLTLEVRNDHTKSLGTQFCVASSFQKALQEMLQFFSSIPESQNSSGRVGPLEGSSEDISAMFLRNNCLRTCLAYYLVKLFHLLAHLLKNNF